MKNNKAKMFNKKASNPKNKPDKIIETMALKPGQNIVDIGSGGGYFTLRFSKIVGKKGKIYAVDTNPEFLGYIKINAKEKGLDNIITTFTTEDKVDLPEKSIDFIFMRNVTHHLPNRVKYFSNFKNFLKPNGKIIVIEHKKGKTFSFKRLFGHYVSKENIIREMNEAGFSLEKDYGFLPEQHFTIFSKQS